MIECINDRMIEWGAIALTLLLFSCQSEDRPLVIATAASNQPAMEILLEDFTAASGIEAELVVAASGQLTAQLLAGAPYDVFISADERYPNKLMDVNMIAGKPQVFARGSLVLWSGRDDVKLNPAELTSGNRLAIANPKVAPFGRLADSLLRLRPDYSERIQPRLVYGESIGQVNQFVFTGAVEMGLTARSIVHENSRGRWEPFYPEVTIPQTVSIIRGNREEDGRIFIEYLLGTEAQETLRRAGYSLD
ncbi:molybdate ABC transporter substrate-binding protein [Lewinellaceae bacterium SD302]|nr:molybdate ABC transporter substrate-binding protein [Lewinellaceae bacterium SD302]